jgi:MFS transporter, DHA2 family, methylenomycin A resistance protein
VVETRRHRHPLDTVGQLLAVVSLSTLTGGFILAGEQGWLSGVALALLTMGLAGAAAFAWAERAVRHPMIDPVLFVRRTFTISVSIGVIFNFCLYGGLFCLAIDLHGPRGLGALETGMAMLPMTLVTGATAFLTHRTVARYGEWPVMTAGLAAGVAAAILVALTPGRGPLWVLVASTIPLGLTAMAMPAMTATAMAGAPHHRVGLAAGVLNTARQTGGAFGIALLGALLRVSGGVTLHASFTTIAGAYALGVGLAACGRRAAARESPQTR